MSCDFPLHVYVATTSLNWLSDIFVCPATWFADPIELVAYMMPHPAASPATPAMMAA